VCISGCSDQQANNVQAYPPITGMSAAAVLTQLTLFMYISGAVDNHACSGCLFVCLPLLPVER
jgi:hypothetical protein